VKNSQKEPSICATSKQHEANQTYTAGATSKEMLSDESGHARFSTNCSASRASRNAGDTPVVALPGARSGAKY
jgi:hypothetical protein